MVRTAVIVGQNRGACEALARAGIKPAVVDDGRPTERYGNDVAFFVCPPYRPPAPEAFVAHLELVARIVGGQPVLFAASDTALLAIAEWRERLARSYAVACAEPDLVRRLVSKVHFARWAEEAGIPIPRSRVVRDEAELARELPDAPLPCVVKPEHTFALEARVGRKLYCARTRKEVEEAARACLARGLPVVLQEDVSGAASTQWSLAGLCDDDSRVLRAVLAQKLRQVEWGAGTAMETLPMDEGLLAMAQDLATQAGLRGLFELELRAGRAGRPVVIEVNPRIWRQVNLPAAAGVNLLEDAWRLAAGEPLTAARAYRPGVGWLRWRGDLSAILGLLRRNELSPLALARSLPRVRVVE